MILSSLPKLAWLAVVVVSVVLLLIFDVSTVLDNDINSQKGKSLRRQEQATALGDANKPDGFFNNLPVHYKEFHKQFHSNAHCIGENFVDSNKRTSNSAWKYRSCSFQNLCFDMVDQEFVLFISKEQRALENALIKVGGHQVWPASSSFDRMAVSVGGVHPRWGGRDIALKWYPKFRKVEDELLRDSAGFYMLPSNHVMVPWNSYHGYNPGHIITDDFLPIYTLLSYFDFTKKELAMVHIDLPDNDDQNTTDLWDNCQNHWKECKPYMEKFLPLLGTRLDKTSTQYTATLETKDEGKVRSRYVCSHHGVAGMGMLTDHGNKLHGNFEKDFLWTHNVGRGDSFYRFRNWMAGRLLNGTNIEKRNLSQPPYRIVISNNSSSDSKRNVSFGKHADMIQSKLGEKYDLDIRQVKLSDMSLADQVKLAAETSIFITAAGGGVSTAHFLPRGASLLIYFEEFGPDKEVSGDYNGWVMDWDTYNNFGYIRTHWLPIRHGSAPDDDGRGSARDMNVFIKLVDQELDLISHIGDDD